MPPGNVNERRPQHPMRLSKHLKNPAVAVYMNPWTFIGLSFVVQVLGSIWVIISSGLALQQVAWPIAILVLGGVHAFMVRFWLSSSYARWKQHWAPAVFYSAFIFILSNSSFEGVKTSIDANSLHPLEYAALGLFLCWMGHRMLLSGRAWDLVLRVFLGGMAFAVLDEFHQSFIVGRTASFTDLMLDSIGLVCGIGLFFLTGPLWGGWEGSSSRN